MIVGVENLHDFGVSMGILPEDRQMQVCLRRMKRKFMSLPLPISDDSESQIDENSEDDDKS
jgi:hypothetical protein